MAKFFAKTYSSPGKSVASITGITEANLAGFKLIERKEDGSNVAYVGYWTVGTFTSATYNAFPTGSIVHDFVAGTLYYKVGATTWESVALS